MCTLQTKTFPNLNKNENIVNHNVWVVDETYLTPQKVLFLITNLKTRAILGYSLKSIKNINYKSSYKTGLNYQEILDTYQTITTEWHFPEIIHSDSNPNYVTKQIEHWCQQNHIQISTTESQKNQNQVAESVNAQIKNNLIKCVLKSTKNNFKKWRKTWPKQFKNLTINNKLQNKEFRTFFFTSIFFTETIDLIEFIDCAIIDPEGILFS
uniref:Integrase catalytic domain-containing protein n=1 Tax=Halimeda micronesica TaxID=170426 RepID=A0A386AXD0_9CHLO|nr:hypothetical protein [Halimeda micronesica]